MEELDNFHSEKKEISPHDVVAPGLNVAPRTVLQSLSSRARCNSSVSKEAGQASGTGKVELASRMATASTTAFSKPEDRTAVTSLWTAHAKTQADVFRTRSRKRAQRT